MAWRGQMGRPAGAVATFEVRAATTDTATDEIQGDGPPRRFTYVPSTVSPPIR